MGTARTWTRFGLTAALGLGVLILAGCAAQAGAAPAPGDPTLAGFWLGVWHGIIVPVTFIVSLFNDHVAIYAVHNTGAWYDFGFVLGLGVPTVIFRGSSAAKPRSGKASR